RLFPLLAAKDGCGNSHIQTAQPGRAIAVVDAVPTLRTSGAASAAVEITLVAVDLLIAAGSRRAAPAVALSAVTIAVAVAGAPVEAELADAAAVDIGLAGVEREVVAGVDWFGCDAGAAVARHEMKAEPDRERILVEVLRVRIPIAVLVEER